MVLCLRGSTKELGQSQPSDCLNAFNYHAVETEPWFPLWCVCVVVGCMVCTCMWRCSCPCRCVWRPVVFINCFSKFLRNWPGWRLSFRQTSWLVSFGHLPISTLCWGLQTQVTMPGFYTGAEVPTFTPHGCMASTLSRELNPQHFSLCFWKQAFSECTWDFKSLRHTESQQECLRQLRLQLCGRVLA